MLKRESTSNSTCRADAGVGMSVDQGLPAPVHCTRVLQTFNNSLSAAWRSLARQSSSKGHNSRLVWHPRSRQFYNVLVTESATVELAGFL